MSDDESDHETPAKENTFGQNKFLLLSTQLKELFRKNKIGGDSVATLIDELFYFLTHAMQPKSIYPIDELKYAITYCVNNHASLQENLPSQLVQELRTKNVNTRNAIMRYALYVQTRMNYLFRIPRNITVSSVGKNGNVTIKWNLKYKTGQKLPGTCEVQIDNELWESDVDLQEEEIVLNIGASYEGQSGEIRIRFYGNHEVKADIPAA